MTTPRYTFPILLQNKASAHYNFNNGIYQLDSFYQPIVIEHRNDPPTAPAPSTGDVYLVGDTPTEDWSNNANNIAYYLSESDPEIITEWRFISPVAYMQVVDQETSQILYYDADDTKWRKLHTKTFNGHIEAPYYDADDDRSFNIVASSANQFTITEFHVISGGSTPPSGPYPSCSVVLQVNGVNQATSEILNTTLDDLLLHSLTGLNISVAVGKKLTIRIFDMTIGSAGGAPVVEDVRFSIHTEEAQYK